jgi:alpha-aminoadipate carrier protein LysW
MIACTECTSSLDLPADAVEGEVVACADCGVELEVVSTSPLALALAPEVDEDWGE